MSGAYPRSLNLDTLYVNTIIYKNPGNKPPPPNQLFVSDGAGGTAFESLTSTISTATRAINEVTAPLSSGGLFDFVASNQYNVLSFGAGAGMQFYSNNILGQPQLILYNTGPEQIDANGQILSFSSLQDQVVGGRTLNYVGMGDIQLYISDNAVVWNSQQTSTLSSLVNLISTNYGLETELSSLIYQTNSTLANADIYATSTGISALNSSYAQKFDFINNISSYFLVPETLNISSISTTNLAINTNLIQDYALSNSLVDPCNVYVGSTILSTNTDFLTFTDTFTNATFAIDKEYMYGAISTQGSTIITQGQQVQVGWFPYLSTQGATASMRNQFVPFSQQLQVIEQTIYPDNTSSITNYSLQNIARFDEICTSNNFIIRAPGLYVSSLFASTINNIQQLPFASNYGEYVFYNGQGWAAGGLLSVGLGCNAGSIDQGSYAVALGVGTGQSSQGMASVAIGSDTGQLAQGPAAIAIGSDAGQVKQGPAGVAIGLGAGMSNQGMSAVAIGYNAGLVSQLPHSIVINATGNELDASTNSGLFIAPVRNDTTTQPALTYNTATSEIVYGTKTFVIPHPVLSNKYLVHACLEGPEAGVYYRGRSLIKPNERQTTIVLPDYVNQMATEFTIQLTPIYNGIPCQEILSATDVSNNSFNVFGPPGPFYWHVYGLRQTIETEPDMDKVQLQGMGPYRWLS